MIISDTTRIFSIHSRTCSKGHLYIRPPAYKDHILQVPTCIFPTLLNLHINLNKLYLGLHPSFYGHLQIWPYFFCLNQWMVLKCLDRYTSFVTSVVPKGWLLMSPVTGSREGCPTWPFFITEANSIGCKKKKKSRLYKNMRMANRISSLITPSPVTL